MTIFNVIKENVFTEPPRESPLRKGWDESGNWDWIGKGMGINLGVVYEISLRSLDIFPCNGII